MPETGVGVPRSPEGTERSGEDKEIHKRCLLSDGRVVVAREMEMVRMQYDTAVVSRRWRLGWLGE